MDGTARDSLTFRLARLNGEHDPARRELDALIREQYWRASHFRVAGDDINYRRFFNINELAGLRVELPEVFEHAHQLIASLLREGVLDGLRIDHIDGLLDPAEYLQRLRALALQSDGASRPFWLYVEKILARDEDLRPDWPVEGTTGYEFANLALRLLTHPEGERALTRAFEEHTGERQPFEALVRECKLLVLRNEMASELNVLARDTARVARQNPRTADFTRNLLRRAIRATIACFPVYRTYLDPRTPLPEVDRAPHQHSHPARAAAGARRRSQRVRLPRCPADRRPGRRAAQRLQPPRGTALRDEVPAVEWPGDGQGTRGHGVLSIQPPHLAQRGGRRTRPRCRHPSKRSTTPTSGARACRRRLC